MRKLFLLVTLIFPLAVQASCWKEIYSDSETDIYIDACSVAQSGPLKKAWFRWIYAKPLKTESHPQKEYDEVKALDYFNCSERTTATVKNVKYGPEPDNQVVESISINPKNAQFDEFTPDTLGEVQFNSVCKKAAQK